LAISFQNGTPTLYINPVHYQYIDEIVYVPKNHESISDYPSGSNVKYKAVLKYGTKLVPDELGNTFHSLCQHAGKFFKTATMQIIKLFSHCTKQEL